MDRVPLSEFAPTLDAPLDPEKPTLFGCWAKHWRAHQHLTDLNREIGRYTHGVHVRFVRTFDPETRVFEFEAALDEFPNYAAWSLLLGDFLHNLRSCLDHLVWQLVLLSGEREPVRGNQFPICSSEERYLGRNGKGGVRESTLAGVNEKHREPVDLVQPYRRGPGAPTHSLTHLQRMGNADKHRILPLAWFAANPPEPENLDFEGLSGEESIEIETYDGGMGSPSNLFLIRIRDVDAEPTFGISGEIRIEFGFGDGSGQVLSLSSFRELWVRVGTLIFSFRDEFGPEGEMVKLVKDDPNA